MKLFLNSLFVGLVSFVWSAVYYLDIYPAELYTKPFVYRVLVPLLASIVDLFGVSFNLSVVLVMTVSGIGFYLALRKLYFYYYAQSTKGEIYVLVSVVAGLLLFEYYRKPYDLSTAFLMTLGLYYILTVQNWKYLIVFTLACLNRETAFLLILVYVVFWLYYRKYTLLFKSFWWMTACQIYVYGLITYCLRLAFQYNPGSSLWVEPWQNLVRYANHPVQTIIYATIIAIILLRVFRNWNIKPFSLRLAFVVVYPVVFLSFLVCGQSFETRTLWEMFPLVVMLM